MTPWDKAKHMYFSDIPVVDISSELKLPLEELGARIFGTDKTGLHPMCWYQERRSASPESFTRYQKVKPYLLTMAESRISDLIVEGSDNLQKIRDMDTMNKAVDVLSKLDKLGRLERGESTENITLDHGFTLRDIANGKQLIDIGVKDDDKEDYEESYEED